ncbi:MAG TPA: hypothetical protein VF731_01720 [Solirubrobacterales bacterium]
MLKFVARSDELGRVLAFVGLTDVNLQRLQAGDPIKFPAAQIIPPDGRASTDLVIFHATRDSVIELAETLGVDQARMLDALGEG